MNNYTNDHGKNDNTHEYASTHGSRSNNNNNKAAEMKVARAIRICITMKVSTFD